MTLCRHPLANALMIESEVQSEKSIQANYSSGREWRVSKTTSKLLSTSVCMNSMVLTRER